MTPKKTRSHALLSALSPTKTYTVQTSPFRSKRTLQLRGPAVIISKRGTPDPTTDKLIMLTTSNAPQAYNERSVTINNVKLHFDSAVHRDCFLTAAHSAIRSSTSSADRYELVREIGRGASGIVSVVRRTDGELFAMKAVSKADVFSNSLKLGHLVSERLALAEAAGRRVGCVVRLEDAFETEDSFCFVTELGSYGDLRAVLKQLKGNRMTEEVARRIFAGMVVGLENVHRMGYLYRDLKLENVLMGRDGCVRLADFGLAKKVAEACWDDGDMSAVTDDDDSFRLTGRTRSFVGTRRYMSPEHLGKGKIVKGGYGAQADVWALGVALYVMLSGYYPFGREVTPSNVGELFHAISNEDFVMPDVSEGARDLLRGLLNRDELERLDLAEVRRHEWMRGMEWGEVGRGTDEVVLECLRSNEVGLIEEGAEVSRGSGLFSLVSGLGSEGGKSVMGDFELLGFGFRLVD